MSIETIWPVVHPSWDLVGGSVYAAAPQLAESRWVFEGREVFEEAEILDCCQNIAGE